MAPSVCRKKDFYDYRTSIKEIKKGPKKKANAAALTEKAHYPNGSEDDVVEDIDDLSMVKRIMSIFDDDGNGNQSLIGCLSPTFGAGRGEAADLGYGAFSATLLAAQSRICEEVQNPVTSCYILTMSMAL